MGTVDEPSAGQQLGDTGHVAQPEVAPDHHGHIVPVIEGRAGFAALGALYADAFAALRYDPHLRASLLRWSAAGLVFTVGFSVGVALTVSTRAAVLAGLGAVGWWLLVDAVLVGGIDLLETPDGRRINYYGWPNGLTALRAWSCLPLLLTAALPLQGQRSLALYIAIGGPVGMLDFVDGWIARRFGPLTRLGQALDPAGDALFFAMAAIGSVLVGIIPLWLTALMLLRYLGPLLATPIVFLARRRPQLVYTDWGRRNTLAFGVVLFVCMLFRVLGGPVDIVALILGVPLLGTTTALHFALLARRAYDAPVVRPSRRELRQAEARTSGEVDDPQ
jgi:phosphatidylglycerophosphate synthase